MLIPELDREAILRMNSEEYAACDVPARWLDPGEAEGAELLRTRLLQDIGEGLTFAFNSTKPVYRGLSPGCSQCGQGKWSCLFISNLCNARCFFCPAEQNNHDEPGTSTLTFSEPEEYADYLEQFGFRGASISGGEPLISLDKTLPFIAAMKRRLGTDIHLWMYTNGTLITPDIALRLADAGLDEIRFNIAATGYDLAAVRMAAGVIPFVTVEIPAVPEDLAIMKTRLQELSAAGVSFLNLHQIRCTPYNREKLSSRGYTFLHGPQVGVLESELTALKLMAHAQEHGIDLGMNYCSLIYRHRFQARSSRQRWAGLMAKPFEGVTGSGLIRTLRINADAMTTSSLVSDLAARGADPSLFSLSSARDSLVVAAELLGMPDAPGARVNVSYAIASVRPAVTYRNPFREVRLPSGKKIVLERATVYQALTLSPQELALFRDSFLSRGDTLDTDALYLKAVSLDASDAHRKKWQQIIQAEVVRSGLLEYY